MSLAQGDTLYVKFEPNDWMGILKGYKNKNDSSYSEVFPFDGGRIYSFKKLRIKSVDHFSFSFFSYTPEWMDKQFYFEEIDKTILIEVLEGKDFKDADWFENTSFIEIIKYFGRKTYGDQIIMLYDETQPSGDKVYLVRVYFRFDAEE